MKISGQSLTFSWKTMTFFIVFASDPCERPKIAMLV